MDPRQTGRYSRTRRAWLDGYRGQSAPCCMCGLPVDTSLPGTHRWGPTIEHRIPIRHILAIAVDAAHAIALACDTAHWGLAHNRCNSRQGQRVTAATNRQRNQRRTPMVGASRNW